MPDNNLHSINKLQDDIKAAKWLSVFLPKEKRQQIKELETSLANMIHLIESFNKYFSDAGWCAYDSMNMPLMENAVKAYEAGGIDAGEQVLIQYYQTDVKDIMHLFKNHPRGTYDLILMDIMMPNMDGHQAAKAIRALGIERSDAVTIPIIALSANAFIDDIQESLDLGMNAHISKPINMEELIDTITKYKRSIPQSNHSV